MEFAAEVEKAPQGLVSLPPKGMRWLKLKLSRRMEFDG
jgi:hypothetical protein